MNGTGIYGFPTEAGVELVTLVPQNITSELENDIRKKIESANRFNNFKGMYEK